MKTNLINKNGNAVPNQFIIFDDETLIFQSYDTVIYKHMKKENVTYIDANAFGYSATTTRNFRYFLEQSGIDEKELRKAIKEKGVNNGYISM